MVIRTSLVFDEQLEVLQVGAIAVAVITREDEVCLKGMTLLTDVHDLVAGTIFRATRPSLQDCCTHEGSQEEQ